MPMLGQMTATFSMTASSMRIEDDLRSVAMTMPFEAVEYAIARVSHNHTHALQPVRTLDTEAGRP